MGMFDFFKNAGLDEVEEVSVSPERIDELREKSIREKVAALDIDGEKISVSVKGETATVSGSAPTQEDLEKIVLCAGNQFGIGNVDCQVEVDEPAAPSASAPSAESIFYTVASGDTLGKIAKAHYGDASKYPIIFEANKPMLMAMA